MKLQMHPGRHPRERGDPQGSRHGRWIPAFAGMTMKLQMHPGRHPRERGDPQGSWHGRWIPAFAGMTMQLQMAMKLQITINCINRLQLFGG